MGIMVITCAVTGAETTREQNRNLPLSPEEIAAATYDAYLAGASIVHLHVRDKQGRPTQDKAVFSRAISLIRKKCDIVIEVTTGGAVGMFRVRRDATTVGRQVNLGDVLVLTNTVGPYEVISHVVCGQRVACRDHDLGPALARRYACGQGGQLRVRKAL